MSHEGAPPQAVNPHPDGGSLRELGAIRTLLGRGGRRAVLKD